MMRLQSIPAWDEVPIRKRDKRTRKKKDDGRTDRERERERETEQEREKLNARENIDRQKRVPGIECRWPVFVMAGSACDCVGGSVCVCVFVFGGSRHYWNL